MAHPIVCVIIRSASGSSGDVCLKRKGETSCPSCLRKPSWSWLSSCKRRHDNTLTVCIEHDFPIQIGAIDAHLRALEALDHLRRRMPEWIHAPAADERNLRTPR